MSWPVPLPPATGDEVADLAAFTAWEQAVERVYHPDRFGGDGARLTVPREFTYYLGVPEPSWLGKVDTDPVGTAQCATVPKFISASRLVRYRSDAERWPVASTGAYAIDSGAYIALNGKNKNVPWFSDPDLYGSMVLRFIDNNGYPPDFCAPQDHPCESSVLKITGFTERDHQDFTLDSYLWLVREYPMVPWIPVLQAEKPGGHVEHAKMYADAGVDLAAAVRVGVGSICRLDQLDDVVARVAALEELAADGLKLHGFGIKTNALPLIGHLLTSADSMAWSFHARKSGDRLPDCPHTGDCRNCYRYAVRWREQVLVALANPEEEVTVPTTTIKKAAKKKTPAPPDLFSMFAALATTDPAPVPDTAIDDLVIGSYVEVTGTHTDNWSLPKTARGYVLETTVTWSCQRPGSRVVSLSAVWPPRTPHGTINPVQIEAGTLIAVLAPADPPPAVVTEPTAAVPAVAEPVKRAPMSRTFAIDQTLIDAPDFPRDHAWWRSFVAQWMGLEMLPDGTVLLTASGSAAQATALGRWIGGTRRIDGAYRRLTRDEAKRLRAQAVPSVVEPVTAPVVVDAPMLFDLPGMAAAIDAAMNQ